MKIIPGQIYLGQKLGRVSSTLCHATSRIGITPSAQKVISSAKFQTLEEVVQKFPSLGKNHCLVFIVRHGQTDWNLDGRLQGWEPVPLNDKGKDQCNILKVILAPVLPFCRIYSSPLERCFNSADIITEDSEKRVVTLDDLKEIHYGDLAKHTWDQVKADYPHAHLMFHNSPHRFKAPKGESFINLRQRADKAVAHIVSENLGRGAVIVGHGWNNKAIFMNAFGLPLHQFWEIPLAPNIAIDVILFNRQRTNNKLWLFHYSELSKEDQAVTAKYESRDH